MAKYLRLIFFLSFIMLLVGAFAPAKAATPRVHVLQVQGAIVPVVADYIQRGIDTGKYSGDQGEKDLKQDIAYARSKNEVKH